MALQSKYNNKCPLCSNRINIGDWIDNKNELKKWAHVKCPTSSQSLTGQGSSAGSSSIPLRNALKMVEEMERKEEEVKKVEKVFSPSPYQTEIFNFVVNGKGNAVIEAVAGSGKTTTIVKALQYIPLALLVEFFPSYVPSPCPLDASILEEVGIEEKVKQLLRTYSIAFLAFNKHIARELKSRSPEYVHVSTLHALGHELLKERFRGIELDEDKVGGKLDDFWPITKKSKNEKGEEIENSSEVRAVNKMKRFSMRKLVSIMKSTLADYTDPAKVQQVIDFYGIEIPEDIYKDVTDNLSKVMARCKSDTRAMDFDDMLWLPIVHNLPLKKFHFLLVDEGQDMNSCQVEYISRSLDHGGRMIVVGDRKQSLYGFRGADVEAIPRMIKELNATVLPLSITYRCPKSHVLLAQGIVPQLQASENAIEGSIADIKYIDFLNKIDVGDMVLCRTNAPLVKPAFEAIRRGKKAIIRGKDIGSDLIKFVEKFEATDLTQLDMLMQEYTGREIERFLNRGKELQADMVKDKYETIKVVADECNTVEDLTRKLKILFSDDNEGIVFSSVHRAKGLESSNIFILRQDLMPHPKARQDWEKVQESNGQYVAYTRSKDALYFVEKE